MAQGTWTWMFQEKIKQLKEEDSWSMEFDNTIEATKAAGGWKEYIRRPFSRFTCSKCHHSWASSKTMVVFHMRLDPVAHVGVVKVRCYKQNCKKCEDPTFEEPSVEPSDLEDMMEKLMEKILIKCYEEEIECELKSFHKKRLKGDHLSALCEACKSGVCDRC